MTSMSARMVAAADGGDGDLLSWVARYGDEASCEEGLMRLRFPGGWVCPRCGNRRCSPVAGRPRKRQCTRCRLQFSVTSGTPMQGSMLIFTKK
ncbi:transposase-like protein [Olsenella profusa DSM 13989]|uniref:transposase n=1 Tax=Olsenella profusa TaxID=138595 RepID=UPI00278509BA|nr:transposase [Olsenella profusa]MDP9860341.1 transposase-like protein [Olsenella profusa DSM 13989]